MSNVTRDNKEEEKAGINEIHLRDHMANERTFLAWIRTSIGIMAFGFVVEKFSLFLRQFSIFFASQIRPSELVNVHPEFLGRSSILGIFLVALGAVIGFLAFIKYKRVEKQIEKGTYQQSFILEVMLTLSILAIAVLLIVIIYLIPKGP